jgi:hypothetical protein
VIVGRALRSLSQGRRALASYGVVVTLWLLVTIGLGSTVRCGPPTPLAAALYWIDVALIVPGLVVLWGTVRWLARASRNSTIIRRWLCTVVAVVGLLAFLGMALFTVILFLTVYGPLNCPD